MTRKSVVRNILALLLILGFGIAAFKIIKVKADSETIHWECPTSGDWNDQANWTISGNPAGRIPINTDVIIMNCATDSAISTSGDIDFSSLTLGSGAGNVTLTLSNNINSGTDLTLLDKGTLVQNNLNTQTLAGTLLVGSGGVVTHTANDTPGNAGNTKLYEVNFSANYIEVDNGGVVRADSKGFGAGNGPGKSDDVTGNFGGAGGTYGGAGGSYGNGSGSNQTPYGSVQAPDDLGSPGSHDDLNGDGNPGGGEIKLEAASDITVNGSITANGGSNNASGGGSGGSVFISTNTITGSGSITANGGATTNCCGTSGAGGGGRIAIIYQSGSAPATTNQAFGGSTGSNGPKNGGAGTIFIKSTAQDHGDLIIDNNNINGANSTAQLSASDTWDELILKNGAGYKISTGKTLTISGSLTASGGAKPSLYNYGTTYLPANSGALELSNLAFYNNGTINNVTDLTLTNASFSYANNSHVTGLTSLTLNDAGFFDTPVGITLTNLTINGGGVFHSDTLDDFSITNIDIKTGGQMIQDPNSNQKDIQLSVIATNITVEAGGSINADNGGYTPGNNPAPSDNPYNQPTHLGFAGTNDSGGGAIKLQVSGTLDISGTISANSGSISQTPDGYGGSIWIDANQITGTGTVSANSGSHGGSGGELAIYYHTADLSTLSLQAFGTDSYLSAPGTIYTKSDTQTYGDITIDANNKAGGYPNIDESSITLDNIILKRKGAIKVPGGHTITLATNGTITSDSALVNGGSPIPNAVLVASGGTLVLPSSNSSFLVQNIWLRNLGTLQNASNLDIENAWFTQGDSYGNIGHSDISTITSNSYSLTNIFDLDGALDSVTIGSGANFIITSTSDVTINHLDVKSGGTLTPAYATDKVPGYDFKLSLISTDVTVESGGSINADAKMNIGSGSGIADGTCSDTIGGTGGSYGGLGGHGDTSTNCPNGITGGSTYGSITEPFDYGSAGSSGGGSLNSANGNVGGNIIKIVTQNLNISGTITANGGDGGSNPSGAGGSGGSVWIDAQNLTGSGIISANGGNGGQSPISSSHSGGAGGGGRVAVYYHSSPIPTATITASAGGSGAGEGTVYLNPQPAPIVTSVDPSSGSVEGGRQVTIHGQYFLDGQHLNVKFGNNNATSIAVVGSTTITATTPASTNWATGAVDVTVYNGDNQHTTLASGYTYSARDPVSETTTLNQHISRGDFGFDISPSADINFGSVTVDNPNNTYNLYYNGDPDNLLQIHDGRYSGGLRVTVQTSSFDPNTPSDPSDDIPASALAVLTSTNNLTNEVTKNGTPSILMPANGTPGQDQDYTSMSNPVVIMDTSGNTQTCDIGRVGTYQTHVSYRLTVPPTSLSGHYHATITYDITEAPLGC